MNTTHFPISKSFLSAEALAQQISVEYALPDVRCQLISASMRDVYLVRSKQKRHVLFVYRHNQRTADEIQGEWQFVADLDANGVNVAPAIAKKNGDLLLTFEAPEGRRYGVLTSYVAGKHLRHRPSIEAVASYGRLIAQIHTRSDASAVTYTRPTNEIERLLKQSIAAFEREVPERQPDSAYLHDCAAILLAKIEALPQEKPYYGMIHGDVIRGNAQISDDGGVTRVTILDFDLCGEGWRAYDI